MQFAELVATSEAVAATRSRTEKRDRIADLLRTATPDEVETAVGFLVGEPRQGRIGVGWATTYRDGPDPASDPSLTVGTVDRAISDLAATSGPGSQLRRRAILDALLGAATAAEAAFVRRLFTGEMRQGALEGVVADAVARAADVPVASVRRAAMLLGDLRKAAAVALAEGVDALDAIGLRVGTGILPMLASTATDVGDALAQTGLARVEWKLDGVRVQVHRDGDTVRVFTRNLNDITERVPEIVTVARGFAARRFILDGEAIGVGDDDRPELFQDTMTGVGSNRLRTWFFDVVHLDGVDLLATPLDERNAALLHLAGAAAVPGITTDDADEAQHFLDDALARGHEGVVVKAVDSLYDAGRRGGAWRKVKPVRTLDLVVIAVEWGSGRRKGWLSNIHLAARHPGDGSFVMVGKTFKGMTDELLAWQTEQFRQRAISDDGRVVQVQPELVVEIALDGVQRSTRYPGGVALRFARVRRYRDDKEPTDADTIDTVRALLQGGIGSS